MLIVDMWHPQLQTDRQREAAMQEPLQIERYRGVVREGYYENTTQRGH